MLRRMFLAASLVSMPVAGQTPRTPWGDPDLQGIWANNTATPLERPDAFAGKETLTDEELEALKEKAAEVLDGGDAFFADDFVSAAVSEDTGARFFDQKTGNYNQFWIVEREFDNRTSLIVDPPNGKLPHDPRRTTAAGESDERVSRDRPCGPRRPEQPGALTYGVPNILAGYNSLFQILQTPSTSSSSRS